MKLTVQPAVSGPKVADRGDIEEYTATANPSVIECRDSGHHMKPKDAGQFEDGGYWRVKRCPSCKTLRHEELDRRGKLLKSWYEYPEGYQLPKGTGRIDSDGKGVFRLASIQRQMMRSQGDLFRAAS